MQPMPAASASRGVRNSIGSPSASIRPLSGGWAPESALTSVDLPAPLSPTSAMTSPRLTAKLTPSIAFRPP